ncbi:Heat shock protein, Hsp 20 family [Desulfonema limicola]|uniref:Heat shock protein, Hsp 20 family n=1 Tax=Desulfonema limicola TaxID=45656 RepID=A0A975B799_9BACT|nr:Hsp20/alpha crystallin family protein [Desulfonema limicola]QTA80136.1 Heat shock protein, Hsp 20 family [Desulfonema limicola]
MITRNMFDFPGLSWRSPFGEIERMRRDMEKISNSMFGTRGLRRVHSGVFPPVNLTEDKDQYYIRAELPGMETGEVDIQIAGNSLAISGERKIPVEEGVKYHRREREAGSFSRIINLPNAVDTEKIEAKLANGILTVSIPKAEIAKPRQITIK